MVTLLPPGLTTIQVLIGPVLLVDTVIVTLAPAASDPDEGETLSSCADRTVMLK